MSFFCLSCRVNTILLFSLELLYICRSLVCVCSSVKPFFVVFVIGSILIMSVAAETLNSSSSVSSRTMSIVLRIFCLPSF